MSAAPRVLLVEDDLDIAASLGDFLEAAGWHVDFAYGAAQARARWEGSACDVLVLDVNLPGADGFSLCREFKSLHGTRTPVLFLTARGNLQDKLRGFAAGAVDYIVKPFAPEELLARIDALTRHLADATEGKRVCLRVGQYRLDLSGRTLARDEQTLPLSNTAFAIIKTLMAAYPGTVASEELCRAVWGDERPESEPLRAHIHQLRRQLDQSFAAALIGTVRGVGYRFDGV